MTNTTPVRPPRGHCVFCTYELGDVPRGPCPVVKRATRVLETDAGPRDVCAKHAKRGTWTP